MNAENPLVRVIDEVERDKKIKLPDNLRYISLYKLHVRISINWGEGRKSAFNDIVQLFQTGRLAFYWIRWISEFKDFITKWNQVTLLIIRFLLNTTFCSSNKRIQSWLVQGST